MASAAWMHLPGAAPIARCGRAAVAFCATQLGCHVGVLYRRDGDAPGVIHLAFHHRLRNEEPVTAQWGWVDVALTDDKLRLVAAVARRIHRAHLDGKVPYALRLEATRFREDGRLALGPGELGLTCSNFVILVFREAGVELLDLPTWSQRSPARVAADEGAQRALVDFLRGMSTSHAEAVAREIGCLRYRPEEVAAASAHPPLPVEFARAEALGRLVLEALKPSSPP